MRATLWAVIGLAALAGCQVADENPNWNPTQDYPSWAYDAPFYYRPSGDLPVAETIGTDVPVYYTSKKLFFIKHPTGYQVLNVPRIAVWYSLDEGQHWERAGYFGAEQTHFLFQAEANGPHWIRLIGPGQHPAKSCPAKPSRVYVVDTVPPLIEMTLDPAAVERDEEGNVTGPHLYAVGDPVKVRWTVTDCTLRADSIRLATTFGKFPESTVWRPFPGKLDPCGELTAPIPPEASRPGGGQMRFRLEARDRAGNVNYAFSDILHIAGEGEPEPRPKPVLPPPPLVAQAEGSAGPRPGWPERGTLLRGGTSRILDWLPPLAAKHPRVILQFSPNNGRSWRTVAENLKLGKRVKWMVPEVNTKICRLRLVALDPQKQKIMLASSVAFTVHTAPPALHLGPKVVPPEPD